MKPFKSLLAAGLLALGSAAFGQVDVQQIVVSQPLRNLVVDSIQSQPDYAAAWIPGHWLIAEGQYVWAPGRWVYPRPNTVWIPPEWEPCRGGYALRPGFWTSTAEVELRDIEFPPPIQDVYRVSDRPSPDHIWVAGYHALYGGRAIWVRGHWERRPFSDACWIAPEWRPKGHGRVFVPGRWERVPAPGNRRDDDRHGHGPQLPGGRDSVGIHINEGGLHIDASVNLGKVRITQAPPAPRPEDRNLRNHPPSKQHIWIAGYWVWRGGRHEWVNGHWERPPTGRRSWVEPRWEHRGGEYLFIEGSWR
jgi:hypothetical protein